MSLLILISADATSPLQDKYQVTFQTVPANISLASNLKLRDLCSVLMKVRTFENVQTFWLSSIDSNRLSCLRIFNSRE